MTGYLFCRDVYEMLIQAYDVMKQYGDGKGDRM